MFKSPQNLPKRPLSFQDAIPHPEAREVGCACSSRGVGCPAFTLIELLVVMMIIVVMTALLVPAFNQMRDGQSVTKAAYDIAGILDHARAYAMANNTYVFVGFVEVDPSTGSSGTGVVAVCAVASRDGTRGYDINSASLPNPAWSNGYNNGANLLALTKIQRFENLHMTSASSEIPNTGGTARPKLASESYELGNTTASPNPGSCVTPFDWPLGKPIGGGQYSFKRVINFDPQGIARIQYKDDQDGIGQYIEIGLQQARGNAVVTADSSKSAAIQVDCMTGSTRIYRP